MIWLLDQLLQSRQVTKKEIDRALSNPTHANRLIDVASRYDTIAFGLKYLGHHFRSPPAPFHYEISEKLARRDYYALAAPRGHAKSTIVALAHPLLEAAAGRARFIVIIGADSMSAQDRLEDILNELAENRALLEDFPHLRPPDPVELRKWAKERKKFKQRREDFVTFGGVRFSARGAGQALRGMKQGRYRPDLIILDDVDTDQRCDSSKQLIKLNRWFDTVVMNLEGVEKAKVRAVGTILCRKALIAQLIRRWGGDIYRAIVSEEKQETLWPAVWSYERLVAKRDGGLDTDGTKIEGVGPRRFAREYLNDPSLEDDAFLDEDKIQIIENLPVGYPEGGYYTAGLDLAVGMDTKSAQNAIVLFWHSNNGVSYVINAERWRGVVGLEYRVKRFIEEYALEPPRLVAVEAVQYQVKAVEDLRNALPWRFVGVHPDRSKSARFALIADRFVNGQIVVLKGVPKWYVDELVTFPVGDSTWDGVDATVYAFLGKYDKGKPKGLAVSMIPTGGGSDWR